MGGDRLKSNITSSEISDIDEISKCINNIISIPAGSIPLSRGMGINWVNLSKIPPDMENDIATEIVEKVEAYEPRVKVSEVTFTYDNDGVATANIIIGKGDGYGRR
jgi:phage baseplate assembly protein W